jgi:hypothetical protein
MERDDAKDMPLSVAFIRVFSVLMVLIGVAEFIISGMLMDASSLDNIGGIYFAVTAVCAGFWGLCMVEGVRQFNMLTLLLFINCICAVVGVVYAGIAIYVVDRIEACSEFDPSGNRSPRCTDQEVGTYSNFTCSGNEEYFLDAAKCGTRFIYGGADTKNDCGCVYVDGGTHCKEFSGYTNCEDMQEILPPLSMGSYVLGYMCLSLSVFLMVCSCTASCTHTKKRGLMSISAEELRQGPGDGRGRPGGVTGMLRGFQVRPAPASGAPNPAPARTAQMVRVTPSATPALATAVVSTGGSGRGHHAGSATPLLSPTPPHGSPKVDATRSPAQATRKKHHHHHHGDSDNEGSGKKAASARPQP